jgi:hypothetical protein
MKASGQSMRTVHTAPRPSPSRKINHQPPASGPRLEPSSMAAPKRSDHLRPSPGSGKPKQQQVY